MTDFVDGTENPNAQRAEVAIVPEGESSLVVVMCDGATFWP